MSRIMGKHEEKICGRCRQPFECKAGDISHCQCSLVQLSEAEHAFIAAVYVDCLCGHCLLALKQEFHQQNFSNQLKARFGNR